MHIHTYMYVRVAACAQYRLDLLCDVGKVIEFVE